MQGASVKLLTEPEIDDENVRRPSITNSSHVEFLIIRLSSNNSKGIIQQLRFVQSLAPRMCWIIGGKHPL